MPGWVVSCAAFGCLIALAAWWWVPKWKADGLSKMISDPKTLSDIEDSWRKTFTQLIGGAAVLVGAGLAYRGTQMTLQESYDRLRSEQQASKDQLVSQQVSKGFELLGKQGSSDLMMRLGGIYALEGVMNASEQYYQPVLDALSTFVRVNTRWPNQIDISGNFPPAEDIRATLNVIVNRKHRCKDGLCNEPRYDRVDLTDAQIPRAIMENANLIGAELPCTNLMHANLTAAKLTGANLFGAVLLDAKLSNADLLNANLINVDFRKADLRGANVLQEQLNNACGDENTKLPPRLTIKPCPKCGFLQVCRGGLSQIEQKYLCQK